VSLKMAEEVEVEVWAERDEEDLVVVVVVRVG